MNLKSILFIGFFLIYFLSKGESFNDISLSYQKNYRAFVKPKLLKSFHVDTLKNHTIFFGINCTRVIVGDVEATVIYNVTKHFSLGIAGGYDYNTLYRQPNTRDSTGRSDSMEGESREQSRYFYGKGPAFRFNVDYNFILRRQNFISLEFLLKHRNYTNYEFRDYPINYSESANQKITGLSVYYGIIYPLNKTFIMRMHFGAGVRWLNSKIYRPDYYYDMHYNPEKYFNYKLVIPAIHFGIIFMIKFNKG